MVRLDTGVKYNSDGHGNSEPECRPDRHGNLKIENNEAGSLGIRSSTIGWGLSLVLAMAFAWMVPFDIRFSTPPFDRPPARAAAAIFLAIAGSYFGKKIGLSVGGFSHKNSVRQALGAAVVVAVWCAFCDWHWRAVLHPDYVKLLTTTPVTLRIAMFAMRALNENILYRLFLSSLLIFIIGSVWKDGDGKPAPGAFWTGFLLSQMLNIWSNVTAFGPLTPDALLHDFLRYVVPGVVWGWLYWRRGFPATEIASTGVHLFFQPLVVLGL